MGVSAFSTVTSQPYPALYKLSKLQAFMAIVSQISLFETPPSAERFMHLSITDMSSL